MCQLFAIILKTDRRDISPYRRVGTEEQDAIAYDALCYPEVFLVLAQVLQGEEELLVGEVQQVARCLTFVPTGCLQQSAKEVEFFIVLKDVGHADSGTVVATQGTHMGCKLHNEGWGQLSCGIFARLCLLA